MLLFIFMLIFLPLSSSADPLDNWHQRISPTTNTLWGVTYGNNTLVVAGGNVGEEATILMSIDGGNKWISPAYVGSPYAYWLYNVCYGYDIFVAVGTYGKILTSSDGSGWFLQKSGTYDDLYAVNCRKFILAVGAHGTMDIASTDGTSWSLSPVPQTNDLLGITCPNSGACVAVGSNGTISNSSVNVSEVVPGNRTVV